MCSWCFLSGERAKNGGAQGETPKELPQAAKNTRINLSIRSIGVPIRL